MPIYTESIKLVLYEEDLRRMWQATPYESERVVLSLLWYTGARPAEIMPLKRKNVNWGIDANGMDFFEIKLETKKLAKAIGFVVNERVLQSSRPLGRKANVYVETIIRWCRKLDLEDYVIVGGRTTRWLNKVMHKLSKPAGHVWSAYHMRHSVFTHMARCGADVPTLMHWKGASHPSSVLRYVHAMPTYINLENQRRERNLVSEPREELREVFNAIVKTRPATPDEIKTLPSSEKDEEVQT